MAWLHLPSLPSTPPQLVLPKEPGLERESISWFTRVYPRTRRPDWEGPPPVDLVQVIEGYAGGLGTHVFEGTCRCVKGGKENFVVRC